LDHLVFAAPDLGAGVRLVESLLGVTMAPGGRHEGFGTWNRLVGLGPRSYMEVVSPDPEQPDPDTPRWFGLDDLEVPRLVTWCVGAGGASLDDVVMHGRDVGVDLGVPRVGQRAREDGSVLRWSMTDPWAERAGGVVPFFIDWGDTPHPAASLPEGCRFVALRAEHPEPDFIARVYGALGLDIGVSSGEAPRLIATLDSPKGIVELR
jgi:hypothetical protein